MVSSSGEYNWVGENYELWITRKRLDQLRVSRGTILDPFERYGDERYDGFQENYSEYKYTGSGKKDWHEWRPGRDTFDDRVNAHFDSP